MPRPDAFPPGAPCWAELATSDSAKSVDFYGELFGWTAERSGEEYGGYVTFSLGGAPVAGCMEIDGSTGSPDVWAVYLATADAAATCDAAASAGATVVVPPMPVGELGTMAFVVDPGGAAVGAWQAGQHRGFEVLDEPGSPGWFELHTRDYDAVVKFYGSVFGWDTHVAGDGPEFRYTTLGQGERQRAGIMDASAFLGDDAPAWSIYFAVEDADATLRRVEELGGRVLMPTEDTPYGRLAVAADATGTRFKLVQ